jgi:hypothetical protein
MGMRVVGPSLYGLNPGRRSQWSGLYRGGNVMQTAKWCAQGDKEYADFHHTSQVEITGLLPQPADSPYDDTWFQM